jgi:hypothetical protein
MLRTHRSAIVALAALVAVPTAGAALALPAGTKEAAATIDAPSILAPIRFLADDLLEGRAPGSRGDALTRIFLAAQLEALGYEGGAGDGTFHQRFAMVGVDTRAPERWSFRAGETSVDLAWSSEYIATSGVQSPLAELAGAELVFVGYGIQAPSTSGTTSRAWTCAARSW